jgi:hypothetical protein
MSFLGNKAKPLLGPIALRADPLPMAAKVALSGGVVASTVLLAVGLLRRHD